MLVTYSAPAGSSATPPGRFRFGRGPASDWYGEMVPVRYSSTRFGYVICGSLSAITMMLGPGLAEPDGPGFGCFGVIAMPRGRPISALDASGMTLPVASASNSISSALFVLGL